MTTTLKSAGLDFDKILKLVEDGFVSVQSHNNFPLDIYNYTDICMALKPAEWSYELKRCRGLIVHRDTHQIIASGPIKTFNYDQVSGYLPDLDVPVNVSKKVDGSLGIFFFVMGVPYVATRGSFHSDQANKANEMLHSEGSRDFVSESMWRGDKTPFAEIIYPENRIVLDYGDEESLIPLGLVDKSTGVIVSRTDEIILHDGITLSEAIALPIPDDEEGYVLDILGGGPIPHVKLKGDTYKRLHALFFSINGRKIWASFAGKTLSEVLKSDGQEDLIKAKFFSLALGYDGEKVMNELNDNLGPVARLIENGAPDELVDWVRDLCNDMDKKYGAILQETMSLADEVRDSGLTGRERFEAYKHHKSFKEVIRLLDNGNKHGIVAYALREINPGPLKPFEERGDNE